MVNPLDPKAIASPEGLITSQQDADLEVQTPTSIEAVETIQTPNTTNPPTEPTPAIPTSDQSIGTPEEASNEPVPEAEPVIEEVAPSSSLDNSQAHAVIDEVNMAHADAVSRSQQGKSAQVSLDDLLAKNATKRELIALNKNDPAALMGLMATGVITPQEVADQFKVDKTAQNLAEIEKMQKAWIRDPDSNIGKQALNLAAIFGTSVVDLGLSIPDALTTFNRARNQEEITDTDAQYRNYLIGHEHLKDLDRQRNTLGTGSVSDTRKAEEAQAEYARLKDTLAVVKTDLEQSPDYARAKEKYVSRYYEDATVNMFGKWREGLTSLTERGATDELMNTISEAYDENLTAFANAKEHMDEGNLLRATASMLAGAAGLGADGIEALIKNPSAILEVSAQSFGMMAGAVLTGGTGRLAAMGVGATKAAPVAGKIASIMGYQSLFATEAYDTFNKAYGHLPQGEQLAVLNGVSALAAGLALGGDKFMVKQLSRGAGKPAGSATTDIASILSGGTTAMPNSMLGKAIALSTKGAATTLTSGTVAGAAVETLQEFTEALAVQYAGLQDLSKINLKDATVEAIMAAGAGSLAGSVGDLGSGYRKLTRSEMTSRLADAKSGYKATRTPMNNIDEVQVALTDSINQLNALEGKITRDADGKAVDSRDNIVAVADMYDTVMNQIAGLDSVFAAVPSFRNLSIRQQLEDKVRKGAPLAQVLTETAGSLADWAKSDVILADMSASPEIGVAITERMGNLSPEQQMALSQDVHGLTQTIAAIVNQTAVTTATLATKYDIDVMSKGSRAFARASAAELRAKAKQAKNTRKEGEADAEYTKQQAADVEKTRSQSKFTIDEVISNYDSRLATESTAEAEVITEPTDSANSEVDAVEELVESTEEELVSVQEEHKDVDTSTPLYAPTTPARKVYQRALAEIDTTKVEVNSKLGTLDNVNKSLRGEYAKIKGAEGKPDVKAYLGLVNALAKELAVLSNKESLSSTEKSKAIALTNAIATYADAYSALPNTDNVLLGNKGLLSSKGINYKDTQQKLGKLGVARAKLPNLVTLLRGLAGNTAKTSTVEGDTDTAGKTGIDRPAASVQQETRSLVHTTEVLSALQDPEVFSLLGTVVAAIMSGKVKELPESLHFDIFEVLMRDAGSLDAVYNQLVEHTDKYNTHKTNVFQNFNELSAQQQAAASAYIALAEYFQRVDPDARDLTYVLSSTVPAVRTALDTKLEKVRVPSEFSAQAQEVPVIRVFEELPVEANELPKTKEALATVVSDGLQSIALAHGQEFLDYLVAEGLAQDGKLLSSISASLADPEVPLIELALTPTMAIRVNTFINANQVASKVQENALPTDATWSSNAYNGVAEALARIGLGSKALDMFKVNPLLKGGMHQVFNLFSVIENPEHENHATVMSNFTQVERAELLRVLPHIQRMRNMLSHMTSKIDAITPYMLNNRMLDLFESMQSTGSSSQADNYLDPAISGIIAQTALEYFTGDGLNALGFNDQESINSIVGKGSESTAKGVYDALHSGSTARALAPRLGALIVKRLGISAIKDKATIHDLGQLENSVGHIALAMLENAGFIEGVTAFTRTSEKGSSTWFSQPGFGQVKDSADGKVDSNQIHHMYRINQAYVEANKVKDESVFSQLNLSKSLLVKLYGAAPSLSVATDAKDIHMKGSNPELNKRYKELFTRGAIHVHRGKLALFNAMPVALQLALFGGAKDPEVFHVDMQQKIKAANTKAEISVARLRNNVKELDVLGQDHFYLHGIAGDNGRGIGHNPTGIDPINITGYRFLSNVSNSTTVTTGSSDPKARKVEMVFYAGLLQALDTHKVEEMSDQQVLTAVNQMESQPEIARALAATRDMRGSLEAVTPAQQQEYLDAMLELTGTSDVNDASGSTLAHAMEAIYAFDNYLTARDTNTTGSFSFDGTMFVEIDGKTNGTSFAIMQNAPISSLEDIERLANSVGFSYAATVTGSFAEIKNNTPNFLDAYQHLTKAAGRTGNALLDGSMSEEVIEELLGTDYVDVDNRQGKYTALMALLAGKTGSLLDAEGNVTSDGRSLFKNVLMTVLYTAGMGTQDRHFVSTIVANHYAAMKNFAKQSPSPELKASVYEYFEQLKVAGVPQTFKMPDTSKPNWPKALLTEEYGLTSKTQFELTELVTNTVGITYRQALSESTYRTIVTQADSLVESSNVVHAYFQATVRVLKAKYVAKLGLAPNAVLTVEQENNFKKAVVDKLQPYLAAPIESIGNGLRIGSQSKSRQSIPADVLAKAAADYAAAKQADKNYKGMEEDFLPPEWKAQWVSEAYGQGETKFSNSQILSNILEAPNQSAAPSAVHWMDSMTQLLASEANMDTPMINLFDAIGGTPETIASMDGAGNKAFHKVNTDYNVYANMAKTIRKLNEAVSSVLTEEEQGTLNSNVGSMFGLSQFDYTQYTSDITAAYDHIAARAQAMYQSIHSIDQYPWGSESALRLNPTKTLEEVAAEHATDMDTFPSLLGEGRVAESKSVALAAAEKSASDWSKMEGYTEGGLQSVSFKDKLGSEYSATVREFKSILQAVATLADPASKKSYANVINAITNLMKSTRDGDRMVLPAIASTDPVEVFKAVLAANMVMDEGTKKALNKPKIQMVIRGATPESVASGIRTGDSALDAWLRTEAGQEVLTLPVNKLLDPAVRAKVIKSATVMGGQLRYTDILRAMLITPSSAAYLGTRSPSTAVGAFRQDIVNLVSKMSSGTFAAMAQSTRMLESSHIKHTKSVINSIVQYTVTNGVGKNKGWNISGIGSWSDNPKQAKAYMNHVLERMVSWQGEVLKAYPDATATPHAIKNQILTTLLNGQTIESLGFKVEEVPAIPAEPEVTTYTEGDTTSVNVDGVEFGLPGEFTTEIKNGVLHIQWTKGAPSTLNHIHEQTGSRLMGLMGDGVGTVFKPAGGNVLAHKLANAAKPKTKAKKGTDPKALGTPTAQGATPDADYTEVADADLVNMFDTMASTSPVKDSESHTERLRTLIGFIAPRLKGIQVRIADSMTEATSGYFLGNTVSITINKLLPRSVTNFMSQTEAMMHELVHAVTRNMHHISPKLSARAAELHRQAREVVKWQDLVDPKLHPEDAEIVAKQLWDYMFSSNLSTQTYTAATNQQEIKRVNSNRVAEFMALVTTNENVGRALNRVVALKTPHTGFTAKVIQLLDAVMSIFFRQTINAANDASITEEMIEIVFTMTKLQNQNQTRISRAGGFVSDALLKLTDFGDNKVKAAIEPILNWSLRNKDSMVPNIYTPMGAVKGVAILTAFFLKFDEIRPKMQAQFGRIKSFKSQAVQDLVNEISENSPDIQRMHDLIAGRSKAVDTARSHTEAQIAEYVTHGLFSVPMSQATSHSLTRAVLETDFNKLVQTFGADKALDILSIDNKRLHSLRKQYQAKLKEYKNGAYYINHAKALGEFLAQGSSAFYGVHSNAYSIARLAGDTEFGSVEVDAVSEIEEAVDVLASLYAVMNTDPAERMRARKFLLADNANRTNHKLDTATTKHNGLRGLLQIQSDATEIALEGNFYGNPQLMRKGYVREIFNPNTEITLVLTSEVDAHIKQGFELVGDVPSGLVESTNTTDNVVMMVNRFATTSSYDQGAFSHTGFDKRGTNVEADLLGMYEDTPVQVLTSQGSKTMAEARKSMFTGEPIRVANDKPVGIAPTRNEDGDIVGYRYTMRTSTKQNVLERDDSVANVLARTRSSVEDKIHSQLNNSIVLDEIYSMYDDMYADNANDFTVIAPDSDVAEHVEMWRMLPTYTRASIAVMNSQRGIPENQVIVPTKLLTLTFGTPPVSVTKAFNKVTKGMESKVERGVLSEGAALSVQYGMQAITKILNTKYGRRVTNLFVGQLKGAKDTVVIKNIKTTIGAMFSNHFTLAVAGIPQSEILRRSVQGYKEILQYQKLVAELRNMQAKLAYTQMSKETYAVLKGKIEDLEAQIGSLSVTDLIDEGLYQTIVEDVDTKLDKTAYSSEVDKLGDKLLGMTGKAETALREGVFLTHDSMTYRYLRDAAQLSDFVGRYVMYTHMMENGSSVKDAVHSARDTFILYDAPLGSILKTANDTGVFNFAKFILRIQGVLRKNIRSAPVRTLMYSALYSALGLGAIAPTLLIMTPFSAGELLMARFNLNPLSFIGRGLTDLPMVNLLKAL